MFHLYVAPTSSQRVIREKYIVSEKRHRLIILTTIHGIGDDVPFARISQQRLHPSSSYCIFPIVTQFRRPLCYFRCAKGPLPFAPVIKERPVLACDHPQGRLDGLDRPLHLMDDVLHPSVLHKCASDFVAHVVGASHR